VIDIADVLALGTPQLAAAYGIADPPVPPSREAATMLLEHAWREGIRWFDTAQAYGDSEELLGSSLGDRTGARVITKLHPEAAGASSAEVEQLLERSRRRLGGRQLWAVLLHRDRMLDEWDGELGQTLRRWREQGAVRHLGISVESVDTLPRALSLDGVEVVQLPASVFDRRAMRLDCVRGATASGKHIFIRSVFLQGLALLDVDRVRQLLPAAAPMVDALSRFCELHALERHQFALDYVRRRLPDATLVVGAATIEQLGQNCEAVRSEPCDPELCDAWDEFWPSDDEDVIDPARWPADRPTMRIPVIIQARMGSSRLPGKVLMRVIDQPVIRWVYERASRIPGTDGVVVATTTGPRDDALVRYCEQQGIRVFRGSEADVLDRMVSCGRQLGAEAVVRITADCPLLDPAESGRVVEAFTAHQELQYASNIDPRTLPDGLDTEVIAMKALEAASREATDPADREHVTPFVRRHPDLFPASSVVSPMNLNHLRLTLDDIDDYTFLSAIAERLRARAEPGSLDEVLAVLEDPELMKLHPGDGPPPAIVSQSAPS
jgi:spore coat polysaccharide biosynthesis protein SpsF